MNHQQKHHEHHRKEREEQIKHRKEHQHKMEKESRAIHPGWFFVLGTALVGVAILVWMLLLP